MARKHDQYRKTPAYGPQNSFVFSDDIRDWMPRPHELSKREKETLEKDKVWRNTSGFRRANNAMLCSERRIEK